MNHPICFISRTDRGGRIAGARLVGEHTDDRWTSGGGSPVDPAVSARAAARWIVERLAARSRRKMLGALCVDADGGVCSWLETHTREPALVAAMIESGEGGAGDDPLGEQPLAGPARFPDLPGEVGYQPIGGVPPGEGGGSPARTPVLAVPDAAVRLLLNELDKRGVRVGRVVSVWHAMASVWDPSSPDAARSTTRADRVVAEDEPVTGCVLLDGRSGRLLWSWSRRGGLVVSGSIRARLGEHDRMDAERAPVVDAPDAAGGLVVSMADVGRLTAEWLSWAAQTGVSPGRIVVVGTPAKGDDALDIGSIAGALSARWSGAPVDALDEPDPMGEMLRRFALSAGAGGDGAGSLETLSRTPGRSHRGMYRWAAAGLLLAAAGLGGVGWQLNQSTGVYAERIDTNRDQRVELLRTTDPELIRSPNPVAALEVRVNEMRARLQPVASPDTPKPVVEAFDMLSFVLASPVYELRQLQVSELTVMVKVVVPETAVFEALDQSLARIAGPAIRWSEPSTRSMGREGKIEATWNGVWNNGTEGQQ